MDKSARIWTPIELAFQSTAAYGNPYLEAGLTVIFRSPSGRRVSAAGFWNGGSDWRVRCAPDEAGVWEWYSICTNAADDGLQGRAGTIDVGDADGEARSIQRHGFLSIHRSGRRFMHADGTPFFWLGDTVWAASANAELAEWNEYLSRRAAQGFNVAQITSLPQWDASECDFRKPFVEVTRSDGSATYDFSLPQPQYFQRLDELVAAAAHRGIVSALVVLWFNYVAGTNRDWTFSLERHEMSADDAYRFGRYLAARLSSYGTVWIVSGDTDAPAPAADATFDAAARGVIDGSSSRPLLTAHFNGGRATPPEWNARSWLDFHLYQSCHFRDTVERAVRYAAVDRAYSPVRPVLNGEPIYDHIRIMDQDNTEGVRAGRDLVRRVAWTSVLSGACAGITYGAHGLWAWHRRGERYRAVHYGLPLTWQECLELPSGDDYALIKKVLDGIDWEDIVPVADASRLGLPPTSVCGRTPGGALIAYSPEGVAGALTLAVGATAGSWVNPTTGEARAALARAQGAGSVAAASPWKGDAILILEGCA